VEPHLVDEDQPLWFSSTSATLTLQAALTHSSRSLALAGARRPFFLVESIRFMARHTTERLTSDPATARR
jgi:hypothetical protein